MHVYIFGRTENADKAKDRRSYKVLFKKGKRWDDSLSLASYSLKRIARHTGQILRNSDDGLATVQYAVPGREGAEHLFHSWLFAHPLNEAEENEATRLLDEQKVPYLLMDSLTVPDFHEIYARYELEFTR